MHKVTVIHPDGPNTEFEYKKSPDYLELQKHVGGMIQTLPEFTTFKGKRCTAYVNENGIAEGLLPNPTARRLWLTIFADRHQLKHVDMGMTHVFGNVAIVQKVS
jgi:hypothetical protein